MNLATMKCNSPVPSDIQFIIYLHHVVLIKEKTAIYEISIDANITNFARLWNS